MILPYIKALHNILDQAFWCYLEHANLRTGYQQTNWCITYVSILDVNEYTKLWIKLLRYTIYIQIWHIFNQITMAVLIKIN